MGGSIALMTTLEQKIKIKHCIMDGGITPYELSYDDWKTWRINIA